MSPVLLAFISIAAASPMRVILARVVTDGVNQLVFLAYLYLVAGILLIPILDLSTLYRLDLIASLLLVLNAGLWIFASILEMRSYENLNASSGEIFGTLTFIVTMVAGIGLFGESVSAVKIIGFTAIISGIVLETWDGAVSWRGARYRLAAAVLTALGVILNKWLAESGVGHAAIVLSGYFLPGLFYLWMSRRSRASWRTIFTTSPVLVAIVPVLSAISFSTAVAAYKHGMLTVTEAIFQSGIILVIVIEVLVMRMYRRFARRSASVVLCFAGACAVIAG